MTFFLIQKGLSHPGTAGTGEAFLLRRSGTARSKQEGTQTERVVR